MILMVICHAALRICKEDYKTVFLGDLVRWPWPWEAGSPIYPTLPNVTFPHLYETQTLPDTCEPGTEEVHI